MPNHENNTSTIPKTKTSIKKPKFYKVIFLNDDGTTYDFVIDALVEFFGKSLTDAYEITVETDSNGSGVAGVYTREISEQKIEETMGKARLEGYPLVLTMEPE